MKPVFRANDESHHSCTSCCYRFLDDDCTNALCSGVDRKEGKDGYFVMQKSIMERLSSWFKRKIKEVTR